MYHAAMPKNLKGQNASTHASGASSPTSNISYSVTEKESAVKGLFTRLL